MGHVYLGNNTPLHECMTSYVVCRGMEVGVSHFFVMFGREMLCEVVRLVVCPFVPEQKELALSDSVPDPVYVHVESFRFFCLMVDVRIPWEVLLSVRIVVGG